MERIVFICGLSHSGSTLLDLVLGGHPRFIGLGEVVRAIDPQRDLTQNKCSCGETAEQCIFWSKAIPRLAGCLEPRTRYQIVYDTFLEVFGRDYILVDSSKYLPALTFLDEELDFNIQVLHIIKDVRAFTISQIDNAVKKDRQRPIFHPYQLFRDWYLNNKTIDDHLKENFQNLKIGYEELSLHPELIAQEICTFLEVDFEPSMLDIGNSNSHVLVGNRMRNRSKKQIRYDSRWFGRTEWQLPALVFRNIMSYNAEQVYRNLGEARWQR